MPKLYEQIETSYIGGESMPWVPFTPYSDEVLLKYWKIDPVRGAKLITVFVASSREAIQGTSYKTASGVLPATLKGKQIRMSAMKMP